MIETVFVTLATIGGLILGVCLLISLAYRIVKSMYSTGDD